jgi:molybdopterin-guanine dinucleotide biosynthesis protein MobB
MLDKLPVFGICGNSGSGKTTLIEKLVPALMARGLKIAAVKHDAHGIVLDCQGKDSDRFFRSGADVFLQGVQEQFLRIHPSDEKAFSHVIKELIREYDLILIEGRKNIPCAKVWLLKESENESPSDIKGIISTLSRDTDRVDKVLSIFDEWLIKQWVETPVYGCVLIGGKSVRMGFPKHLIIENGQTWLEKIIEMMKGITQRVIIAGDGAVPERCNGTICLPDVPDIQGPMSGIVSCMRWAPYASWLVTACDLPNLSLEALQWLLSTRRPGVWATIPMLKECRGYEPLLAHYDFRSHSLLENLAETGNFRPAKISDNQYIINPIPPDHLSPVWRNVNIRAELKSHRKKARKR